jgi:autotransporter-associated beta strand protein
MRNTPLLGSALLLSAALLSLRPAVAATVTWDTSPAAGFQSGSGNWSDLFWTADGTNLGAWIAGDSAVFLGAANKVTDTITLNSNQSISGLTFGTGATSLGDWTLIGAGGLALSANSTITIGTGSTANLATGVSGAFTLTKAGAGTLTLSAANTHTAGTTISAGSVIVTGDGTLGSGILEVKSGATLRIDNNLVANVRFGGNGGVGVTAGDIEVSQGASFSFNQTTFGAMSGKLTGAGAVIKNGAGEFFLSSNNRSAFTGTFTNNGGLLVVVGGQDSPLGSGDLIFTGTSQLASQSTALTLNNRVFVNAGTLLTGRFPNEVIRFDKDVLVKTGAALTTTQFTSIIINANLQFEAGATWTTNQGVVFIGSGGTTGTINGGFSFNRSAGTIEFNRSDAITYSGLLSGTAALRQGGGGMVTVTLSHTHSGGTTVKSGTLLLADGASLGSGAIAVTGGVLDLANSNLTNAVSVTGGTLRGTNALQIAQIAGSTAGTIDTILAGTGSFSKSGTGALTFNGNNSYSGGTTITAGTLSLGIGTALGTGAVTLTGGTLNLNGQVINNNLTLGAGLIGGSGTLAGVVSGTAAFTKSGTSTLVLNGSNTYSGGTTITAGVLTVGTTTALGSGAVTLTGGTLNLNGQTIGNDLTLGAGVIDGSGTLTGVISGASAFSKSGSGTLTFTRNNTYSGGTTISAGTLNAASNGALGSGAVTISGGTLNLGTSSLANTITLSSGSLAGSQLNGDQLVLQGGEVTGVVASGALSKTGSGTVTLSGANTYSGGTTVSAGTLVVNNADALGAGSVTLSGGSLDVKANTVAKDITLTSDSTVAGANGTISGVISGSGLLTKVGSGSLTLSGNNTFAGGALVNAGTLQVNGSIQGSVVVSEGGALAGSGAVGAITVVTGGTIGAGVVGAVGSLSADSLSLQGGAKVELNFSDASLGGGAGFDRFLLSGQLDLSAVSVGNKLTLLLLGLPTTFDPAGAYSFGFITYGSLNLGANGNISDLFTIDASGLKDQFGASLDISKFSLVDDAANNQVRLNYLSEIPEPSTYGLSLGCLGLAVAAVRRRRRMSV